MDGHTISFLVQHIFGALLILLVLLDVFLTVLYARVGAGVLSHHLACGIWWTFRTVARPFPRYRDTMLSFCGPGILVLLVATWIFGLMVGGAMVIQPNLGAGVVATGGGAETARDFATAIYIAGDTIITVGASDYAPATALLKLFYTFMSVVGISMLTLTVTYLLEIYNALQQRNTYAVKLHHATGDTGDAAELVAGVGPRGEFNAGHAHLMEMADGMVHLFESHHFYAVLMYFRFREPHYALSRMALVTLDSVTLIKGALDDEKFGWVKESAAVSMLWRSSMNMLTELAMVFLSGGIPQEPEPDEPTIQRWRQRYQVALLRLREAGIKTIADERMGEETYVALRAKWDRYLVAFAKHMAHPMDQIDPVGANPRSAQDRPEFAQRLRAAG